MAKLLLYVSNRRSIKKLKFYSWLPKNKLTNYNFYLAEL